MALEDRVRVRINPEEYTRFKDFLEEEGYLYLIQEFKAKEEALKREQQGLEILSIAQALGYDDVLDILRDILKERTLEQAEVLFEFREPEEDYLDSDRRIKERYGEIEPAEVYSDVRFPAEEEEPSEDILEIPGMDEVTLDNLRKNHREYEAFKAEEQLADIIDRMEKGRGS